MDTTIDDRTPHERPVIFPNLTPIPSSFPDIEIKMSTGGAVLDDVAQTVTQTAIANNDQYADSVHNGSIFGGIKTVLGGLWNAPLGKVVLLAAAGAIIWATVKALIPSEAKKPVVIPSLMNATTAARLEHQVIQEASQTAHTLESMGVNTATAENAEQVTILNEGLKIRLATPSSTASNSGETRYVTGATPNAYAGLRTLNVARYLNSISQNPTSNDRVENAATLHNLNTVSAQP